MLNNTSLVKRDLRDKVLKANAKRGYVARGAARALASRRSRVLGALVPNLSNTNFSDMIEGFQQRHEPQGHTMLLATFNYNEAAEFCGIRTMIEHGVVGLVLEGQAQGIRVPAQLSIVGVGDLEIVTHMKPPLTTVRSPKRTIGAMAADYLLARISGHDFAIPEELPLELVVRGSTAPPRMTRRKDTSA